jgi:AcrR family transcriptional regulator
MPPRIRRLLIGDQDDSVALITRQETGTRCDAPGARRAAGGIWPGGQIPAPWPIVKSVPATRRHLDRDAKRSEILDAAETLMLRDGYQGTSMVAIARAAGVASNAVYWYFPSKDELLAAVLRRRVDREVADFASGGLEERVLALLSQLDQVASLTAAVHERVGQSPAVARMHLAFHSAVERVLSEGFQDAGLTPDDARCASEAVMAMIDGVHLHDRERDPVARDRLMLWAVDCILTASSQDLASLS